LNRMFDFDDPFGENRRLFLNGQTGEPVKKW
jgi:hypothetical protein